jgi:hypothetical protein
MQILFRGFFSLDGMLYFVKQAGTVKSIRAVGGDDNIS